MLFYNKKEGKLTPTPENKGETTWINDIIAFVVFVVIIAITVEFVELMRYITN